MKEPARPNDEKMIMQYSNKQPKKNKSRPNSYFNLSQKPPKQKKQEMRYRQSPLALNPGPEILLPWVTNALRCSKINALQLDLAKCQQTLMSSKKTENRYLNILGMIILLLLFSPASSLRILPRKEIAPFSPWADNDTNFPYLGHFFNSHNQDFYDKHNHNRQLLDKEPFQEITRLNLNNLESLLNLRYHGAQFDNTLIRTRTSLKKLKEVIKENGLDEDKGINATLSIYDMIAQKSTVEIYYKTIKNNKLDSRLIGNYLQNAVKFGYHNTIIPTLTLSLHENVLPPWLLIYLYMHCFYTEKIRGNTIEAEEFLRPTDSLFKEASEEGADFSVFRSSPQEINSFNAALRMRLLLQSAASQSLHEAYFAALQWQEKLIPRLIFPREVLVIFFGMNILKTEMLMPIERDKIEKNIKASIRSIYHLGNIEKVQRTSLDTVKMVIEEIKDVLFDLEELTPKYKILNDDFFQKNLTIRYLECVLNELYSKLKSKLSKEDINQYYFNAVSLLKESLQIAPKNEANQAFFMMSLAVVLKYHRMVWGEETSEIFLVLADNEFSDYYYSPHGQIIATMHQHFNTDIAWNKESHRHHRLNFKIENIGRTLIGKPQRDLLSFLEKENKQQLPEFDWMRLLTYGSFSVSALLGGTIYFLRKWSKISPKKQENLLEESDKKHGRLVKKHSKNKINLPAQIQAMSQDTRNSHQTGANPNRKQNDNNSIGKKNSSEALGSPSFIKPIKVKTTGENNHFIKQFGQVKVFESHLNEIVGGILCWIPEAQESSVKKEVVDFVENEENFRENLKNEAEFVSYVQFQILENYCQKKEETDENREEKHENKAPKQKEIKKNLPRLVWRPEQQLPYKNNSIKSFKPINPLKNDSRFTEITEKLQDFLQEAEKLEKNSLGYMIHIRNIIACIFEVYAYLTDPSYYNEKLSGYDLYSFAVIRNGLRHFYHYAQVEDEVLCDQIINAAKKLCFFDKRGKLSFQGEQMLFHLYEKAYNESCAQSSNPDVIETERKIKRVHYKNRMGGQFAIQAIQSTTQLLNEMIEEYQKKPFDVMLSTAIAVELGFLEDTLELFPDISMKQYSKISFFGNRIGHGRDATKEAINNALQEYRILLPSLDRFCEKDTKKLKVRGM